MPHNDLLAATAAGVKVENSEPAAVGMRQLYTAYQKASIYAAGHPAAIHATLECTLALSHAMLLDERDPSLLISVAKDRLYRNDVALADEEGALASLANLLRDLGINGIQFDSGLESSEIESLVQIFGQARREALHGAPLSQMLETAGVRKLRLLTRKPQTAKVSEPSISALDRQEDEDVWETLESMLGEDETTERDIEPEAIAEQIEQELEKNEGTGIGKLREKVQDVARDINEIDAKSKRGRARVRLGRFVSALNPKLRQDLLRFDSHVAEETLSLMTELGDAVPETDLLDALSNLDRVGARVPEQLLTLMGKLLRVSQNRPTLASGLKDTMSKWGVSQTAIAGDAEDLRSALEEVFRRRERIECNPIPHQELLETLARYDFEAPSTLCLSRYRDPSDSQDVHSHSAQIAVRLVTLPGGDEYRCGIFHYLQHCASALLEAKQFDALRDAADAAQREASSPNVVEATYRAAISFLNEFDDAAIAARLVHQLCSEQEFPDSGTSLLVRCGKHAVDPAIQALIEAQSPSAIEGLQKFLSQAPVEALEVSWESRLDRGWSCWQQLFAVMRRMPRDVALHLLSDLLDHEEFEVRREALVLLHDLDGDRPLRLAELKRALCEDSARFARVAVRCLAEMDCTDDDEPIQMLGDYIDGSLGVEPVFDGGVRAAQSLIRLKQPGLQRLCQSLDQLQKRFDPRLAALGRRITELLASDDSEQVSTSIRRWKRSRAGIVSLFVPRTAELDDRGKA
jgi:hypothetical protein